MDALDEFNQHCVFRGSSFRLAIVGSRDFTPLLAVRAVLAAANPEVIIISGGARGVDSEARKGARALGLRYEEYLAEWDKHGKGAGMIRNTIIAEKCDALIAFWDGKSQGTRDAVEKARKLGRQVLVIDTDEAIRIIQTEVKQ